MLDSEKSSASVVPPINSGSKRGNGIITALALGTLVKIGTQFFPSKEGGGNAEKPTSQIVVPEIKTSNLSLEELKKLNLALLDEIDECLAKLEESLSQPEYSKQIESVRRSRQEWKSTRNIVANSADTQKMEEEYRTLVFFAQQTKDAVPAVIAAVERDEPLTVSFILDFIGMNTPFGPIQLKTVRQVNDPSSAL